MLERESKKIAIIGAGIAGLYLAWKLSEKGHKITLFEKREKIGKECCSGLFSERILGFIPQAKSLIEKEFNTCHIHFPKKTFEVKFKRQVLFIEHYKLDNLVAELAKNVGAEILLNQNLDELPPNFDRIIGCDGPLSFVRRKLNLANPLFYLGIQKFIQSPIVSRETFSEKVSRETLDTWPIEDGLAPHHFFSKSGEGFLWKIPRKDIIEYGIIAPPLKAERIFEEFLQEKDIGSDNLKSALIPQGLILPKNPKITLCGDAAGLCKPWTGGGVIWGLIAAELLIKHFPDLLAYRKAVRKFFLPQIFFSKTANKLVRFLGFNLPWLLPKKVKMDNDFLSIRY